MSPLESFVTNVFKPNAVNAGGDDEGAAPDSWRHSTIGATFVGSMNQLIANKRASIVWEAGLDDFIFI